MTTKTRRWGPSLRTVSWEYLKGRGQRMTPKNVQIEHRKRALVGSRGKEKGEGETTSDIAQCRRYGFEKCIFNFQNMAI